MGTENKRDYQTLMNVAADSKLKIQLLPSQPMYWVFPAKREELAGPCELFQSKGRVLREANRTMYLNIIPYGAKKHKQRPWMSDHYHYRIQKKWSKRFEAGDKRMQEAKEVMVWSARATVIEKIRRLLTKR